MYVCTLYVCMYDYVYTSGFFLTKGNPSNSNFRGPVKSVGIRGVSN